MDFITIPLVVGMITLGIYKLFELFVRKAERLRIIEKVGEKFDASMIENRFSFPSFPSVKMGSFGALKAGCLIMGIGLGLLIGYVICANSMAYYTSGGDASWNLRELAAIVYGACTLLFGGLGLIIAFVIEIQLTKEKKKEE